MTNIPKLHLVRALGIFLSLALLSSFSAFAADAGFISGTVRNQSRGQAAAGDDVILLRLDEGMQEEARSKTDAAGAFTISVQFPDKPHLVRIVHQGVNYDQQASAGDSLAIDVFDVAAKVPGISGNIEILRAGNNGNLLHVSDMIEIKNESNPPLTQAGARTFEVYLPAQAKIDSVLAAGAGRLGVIITASPVAGEPGHYTVSFPLRPGSTKFAFNYDLPYDGHTAFRPRFAYPLKQFAVMIPPTMKFSSHSAAFQALATGDSSYQVQAANQLKAGSGPSFELAGAGAIPSLQTRSQPQSRGQVAPPGFAVAEPPSAGSTSPGIANPAQPAPANSAAAGPSAPTVATSRLEWRLLIVIALVVLGGCAFLIWRARGRSQTDPKTKAGTTQASASGSSTALLLEALKEELLTLETNRIKGLISAQEYDSAKRTLEGTVKRALARAAAKQ
jgi:hypothetical protein